MSRPRNASRIARVPLFALVVLLAGGSIGSIVMAGRARAHAQEAMVTQARSAVENTLSSIFSDNDLRTMSSPTRAATLNTELSVALGATAVSDVTLYSSMGAILYDIQNSRIGNKLLGERLAIKTATHGGAVPTIVGTDLTVMLPIQRFGTLGAVMLTMPKAPIDAAGRPWTAAGLIMALCILPALFMLWWVGRIAAASGANISFRLQQMTSAPSRREQTRPSPAPAMQHGLKEEGDARRMSEERARAAEERLSVLQEQYRKTLADLHASKETPPPATGSKALEERALQAEGKLRLLEGQLRAVSDERDKMEEELRLTPAAAPGEPDPRLKTEYERMETELVGVRAELEGTQTELSAANRELTDLLSTVGRAEGDKADRIRDLEQDLDAAHVQILTTQEALEAARAEADQVQGRAGSAQTELGSLREAHDQAVRDRDAAILSSREESESLHRELDALSASAGGETEAVRAQAAEARAALTAQTERIRELQQQLDAARSEILRAEETGNAAGAHAETTRTELEATRKELRALRNEEQRAAMLEDELRATRAELENTQASQLAELAERDADLEGRVRRTREEFQAVIGERDVQFAASQNELGSARSELGQIRMEASAAANEAQAQTARADDLAGQAERAERELHAQQTVVRKTAADLQEAVEANADLARKLQDLENRRQLELADEEGHLKMDQILYATQERLAGQTERLIETEERAHEAERSVEILNERLDETLSQLRALQMADALRDLRGEEHAQHEAAAEAGAIEDEVVRLEDRRASSPFLKELTLDARKSLTQILGITQILKFKKDAKDQAQLVKQLTAYARRLDLTVSDLADADKLARGSVELTVRRTDLEALVQRVVEESDVSADHDVRVVTESVVCGVDQLRTEQALAGLLRSSADRTPQGKSILVTLQQVEGGALISVGDPEPSSDGSLSPVVRRFAEIQGGWAKVDTREDGTGSMFRIFLPDGGSNSAGADLRIVVNDAGQGDSEDAPWNDDDQDMLVREIGRLAEPS